MGRPTGRGVSSVSLVPRFVKVIVEIERADPEKIGGDRTKMATGVC
jgi:hypothetical protein